MKRETLRFDSTKPKEPGEYWIAFEQAQIVAHYVSRFASPRDALQSMIGGRSGADDSAHVPEIKSGYLGTDEEWRGFRASVARLDRETASERNRYIRDALKDVGFCTRAEVRYARRNVTSRVNDLEKTLGIRAGMALIDMRVVDETDDGRRHHGTLEIDGPNHEPRVHVAAWLDLIVLPILIAFENPAAFFGEYAPALYRGTQPGAFDVDRPEITIPSWGRLSYLHNPKLKAAFASLPKQEQRRIARAIPLQIRADGEKLEDVKSRTGLPDDEERVEHDIPCDPEKRAAIHLERLEYYEGQFAIFRGRKFKRRGEPQAQARMATQEKFDIGEKMFRYSITNAKRVREARSIPRDGEDFVLAGGTPVFLYEFRNPTPR